MFPAGSPSTVPQNDDFVRAYQGTRNPLMDYCFAGVGVNDPSLGLMYQMWRARLVNDGVLIGSEITGNGYQDEFVFYRNPSCNEVTLAFDNNMQPAVCLKKANEDKVYLRWFDILINDFRTTELSGITEPFLRLDDNRPGSHRWNDIILVYRRGASIFYRLQRDRYGVEYFFTSLDPVAHRWQKIYQVGMNTKLRFQFEIVWDHMAVARCSEKWTG